MLAVNDIFRLCCGHVAPLAPHTTGTRDCAPTLNWWSIVFQILKQIGKELILSMFLVIAIDDTPKHSKLEIFLVTLFHLKLLTEIFYLVVHILA